MEHISQRLDQLDRERFRDMVDSPPFRLLQARIEKELNRLRETTESHTRSIKEIRIAQGGVQALRCVLNLPNQIVNEMRNELKGQPK